MSELPVSLTAAAPPVDPASDAARLQATATGHALRAALDSVLLGLETTTRLVVATVLARGHVLLEDRPGVGKTLLAKTLAAAIGGSSARIQGSIDVLPADITGGLVLHRDSEGSHTFRFVPGPIFHNVVILDELNRISPKAQAALLEAMEERQVSVDGRAHPLPSPFLVIATQNHLATAGTYPLLQGQLDRFTIGISLGLPTVAHERDLLLGTGGHGALERLTPVTSLETLRAAQSATAAIHLAPMLADYIVRIVRETRRQLGDALGASPRAALLVVGFSRALAILDGRNYVIPDDIQQAIGPVLGRRLFPQLSETEAASRIAWILGAVPAPLPDTQPAVEAHR